MAFPQCPRCGDDLSELVPSEWHPGDQQDVPPFCTTSVCTVCVAELSRRKTAGDADTADVQKRLAEAANVPAFPSTPRDTALPVRRGITFRAYVAALAVPAFAAIADSRGDRRKSNEEINEWVAEMAVGAADALVAALLKKST